MIGERCYGIDMIVSRHPATVEYLREEFGDVPVLESATAADVKGKTVAGNLPLHLAAHCDTVVCVEFAGTPPRGLEYDRKAMIAAGVRLRRYLVHKANTTYGYGDLCPMCGDILPCSAGC